MFLYIQQFYFQVIYKKKWTDCFPNYLKKKIPLYLSTLNCLYTGSRHKSKYFSIKTLFYNDFETNDTTYRNHLIVTNVSASVLFLCEETKSPRENPPVWGN